MDCWTNASGDRYIAAGHESLRETVSLPFEGVLGWTNLHFLLKAAVFAVATRAALSLQRAGFECLLQRRAARAATRTTAAASTLVRRSLRLVHKERGGARLKSLRRVRCFMSRAGRLLRGVNS